MPLKTFVCYFTIFVKKSLVFNCAKIIYIILEIPDKIAIFLEFWVGFIVSSFLGKTLYIHFWWIFLGVYKVWQENLI